MLSKIYSGLLSIVPGRSAKIAIVLANITLGFCDLPSGELLACIKKFCQLPIANLVDQWACSRTLVSMNSIVRCGQCSKVFKSHQAKTLHEFKTHGIKDPIRCYAPTTICVCCMRMDPAQDSEPSKKVERVQAQFADAIRTFHYQ